MAVAVREGIDYRLLDDNYRKTFMTSNKPKKDLFGREYYRCIYCGEKVFVEDMEVDHIIPKTRLKAGILWNPNKEWNLGPSCGSCNASKSNKLDQRVFIGFRNKMLSKIGFVAKSTDQAEYEETSETTWKITALIGLVSLVMLLCVPVISLVYFVANTILSIVRWSAKKGFKFGKKSIRKVIKKSFKILFKHPVRNALIIAALVYIAKTAPQVYTMLYSTMVSAATSLINLV